MSDHVWCPRNNFRVMETIILDSSVWISYFGKDCHLALAEQLLAQIESEKLKIMIPTIVYGEIINNLSRIDPTHQLTNIAEMTLKKKNFRFINPNKKFWFNKIRQYAEIVQLKTMDLAILAIAFEFKADQLYSFDVRLQKAYYQLKRSYEETKEKDC